MRVNRTLLYSGIFLVAIGGVVVAADLGIAGESILTGALRLWPLAVIALGLGLVLRRTRVGLSGGMLAAAVPGLLIGSAFAVVPRYAGFCTTTDAPTGVSTEQGTFDGRANISVTVDCGSLAVTTAPGGDWRLDARTTNDVLPVVRSSSRSLSVASSGQERWLGNGPDDWTLSLPTSDVGNLSLTVNAGRGDIDLADAHVGTLFITGNAAAVVVDASTATVTDLTGQVSFGKLTISLPEGDLTGTLTVDAGAAQVCVPDGVGLRVTSTSDAGEVSVGGVEQTGTWLSQNYAAAPYRADLEVHADFGVVEINPIGGCK